MWTIPVSPYDKPCEVCGENVHDKAKDFTLCFPEIENGTLVCAKCVFKALTGRDGSWSWETPER